MNAQPGQDPTAVVDLGWHTDPEHMTQPFIPGISNEDLWLLVRRFNKVSPRIFRSRLSNPHRNRQCST